MEDGNTARTAAQKWKVNNMELIDREALSMELANEVLCAYAKADFRLAKALNVFQFLIDKAPTVEERKHGHWIEHPEHPIGDCSVCGERVPIYSGSKKYKICPYCGAIMDGKAICDD